MTNKKAILIGCSAAAGVGLVALVAIILFFVYMGKDVEGMDIGITSPPEVAVGNTFDLQVSVTNSRSRKPLKVSDVDIAEEYLAAFILTSTTPGHKSSMHVPVDNSRSFTFDVSLPARGSTNFIFHLRAQKPGIHRGDVDVCEGARFTTKQAETAVKAKE